MTWRTTLIGLTVTPTQSTAAVRRSDGTNDTISARWVVGADGARSPVRHALGIDFSGGTYSQTGLLADVELEIPAEEYLPTGTLRLNLTSGGFVGIFGLGKGRHRLFGAVPPGFTTPSNDSERIRVFAELEQTHPEMDGDERVGEVEQRSAADQRTELGGPPAPVLGASGGQVEGDHRRRGRELHVPALIPVEQPPNGGQKVTSGLPKKSEMKLMKKKPKNTTLTSSSTVCHHFGRAVLGSLRFR